MNNLLTLKEVAELLKIKVKTLKKWDKLGTLKAVRINSRGDRRYKLEDIEKYLQDNQEE
jgi:excisionase family DNA binding protein